MSANRGPRDLAELEELVRLRLPETAQLEFKRGLPGPDKNDDIAKDVSAMANSDGGAIIYGIAEDGGVADALVPFPLAGAPERISMVARSSIDEPIKIDPIYRIYDRGAAGEGYLVMVIGRSARAPHFVKGTAWGRTTAGNTRLTRRQIGELFAGSAGFATEFHLAIAKPGRVRVTTKTEPYHDPGSSAKFLYWLVLENDGESIIYDVRWGFDTSHASPAPNVESDPFPVATFQPGASMPMRVHFSLGSNPSRNEVKVQWKDEAGISRNETWPVAW